MTITVGKHCSLLKEKIIYICYICAFKLLNCANNKLLKFQTWVPVSRLHSTISWQKVVVWNVFKTSPITFSNVPSETENIFDMSFILKVILKQIITPLCIINKALLNKHTPPWKLNENKISQFRKAFQVLTFPFLHQQNNFDSKYWTVVAVNMYRDYGGRLSLWNNKSPQMYVCNYSLGWKKTFLDRSHPKALLMLSSFNTRLKCLFLPCQVISKQWTREWLKWP